MKPWLSFFAGVLAGVFVLMIMMIMYDYDPGQFEEAMKPALNAKGIKGSTSKDLAIALNPCIVNGPLPDGCKAYIQNGVVYQPPIKIIIDESVGAGELKK